MTKYGKVRWEERGRKTGSDQMRYTCLVSDKMDKGGTPLEKMRTHMGRQCEGESSAMWPGTGGSCL